MSRRIRAYEAGGNRWEDDFEASDDEPAAERSVRPGRVEILFDHPRCTVVSKPSGVLTIPARHGEAKTIVDLVEAIWRKSDPDAPRPVICHRLDRGTSGCLLLAKDREAAKELMRQFSAREVEKTYLALVIGAPQPPAGTVEFRAAPDKYKPGAMWTPKKGGSKCCDHYETLEAFRGVSLVRVSPETGRTHEVRLAMLTLGSPCAVDPLYGSADGLLLSTWKTGYRTGRGRVGRPLIDRLTLHAESIVFRPPGDPPEGPAVSVTAPLPRDFAATLRQLRRHAAPGSL